MCGRVLPFRFGQPYIPLSAMYLVQRILQTPFVLTYTGVSQGYTMASRVLPDDHHTVTVTTS